MFKNILSKMALKYGTYFYLSYTFKLISSLILLIWLLFYFLKVNDINNLAIMNKINYIRTNMAGLIDMIINNPAIAKTIAKQVGIDINDADSIIGKLAPILMGGAKSNLESDRSSGGLIKHI